MNRTYAAVKPSPLSGDDQARDRRQVCEGLLTSMLSTFGTWHVDNVGQVELRLISGERYLIDDDGITCVDS
jgi:hypothetical protein